MTSQIKTKILVLGPIRSGKTAISNYLADSSEVVGKEYRPTQGVRIVEFESNELELGGERIEAELLASDSTWLKRSHTGVYNEFVLKTGTHVEHTLVLLHHTSERTNDSAIADFKLPPEMSGVLCVPSNIDQEGEALRLEFNNFLCSVIADAKTHSA